MTVEGRLREHVTSAMMLSLLPNLSSASFRMAVATRTDTAMMATRLMEKKTASGRVSMARSLSTMGTPVGSKTTLGAAAAAAVVTIVVVVLLRLRDVNWSLDGTLIPLWMV